MQFSLPKLFSKRTCIPIVLCFDAAYANWAAVTIYSAFTNSKTTLKFYCLVPKSEQGKLGAIEHLRNKFKIEIEIIYFDIDLFQNWSVVGHFSPVVYSKFLIPELVKEKKVIYLDSDILVLNDLSELYQTELNGYAIAGVLDTYGEKYSAVPRDTNDSYINTGVLLLDLNLLRRDNFIEKCTKIYHEFSDILKMVDQCVINKYAENKKVILDKKWNTQVVSNTTSINEWNEHKEQSSIIHFIFNIKPWMSWCNPLIFRFYCSYANKIEFPNLNPIAIIYVHEAVTLANVLDFLKDFETSSKIKTQLINILISKVHQKNNNQT